MYFMFFFFYEEDLEKSKQRLIDRLIKEVPESLEWAHSKIIGIDNIKYIDLIVAKYESNGYTGLEEYVDFFNNHRRFNAKEFWDKQKRKYRNRRKYED